MKFRNVKTGAVIEAPSMLGGNWELIGGKAPEKDTAKSVFVTSEFEVMKSKGPGKCGHIAVYANNVERAIYHLGKRGVKFNEESATFNADGTRKFIYLAEEFGGFGIHLMQKK